MTAPDLSHSANHPPPHAHPHMLAFDTALQSPLPTATRPPVHIRNSLAGKLVRRWNFLHRYLVAQSHRHAIRRFQPVLESHFIHEWLAGTKVTLRFLSGDEEREFRIPWT